MPNPPREGIWATVSGISALVTVVVLGFGGGLVWIGQQIWSASQTMTQLDDRVHGVEAKQDSYHGETETNIYTVQKQVYDLVHLIDRRHAASDEWFEEFLEENRGNPSIKIPEHKEINSTTPNNAGLSQR